RPARGRPRPRSRIARRGPGRRRRAGCRVPPRGGGATETLPAERRDRLSDSARDFGTQLVAHDAADVVLAEDRGRELHWTPTPQRPVAGVAARAGGTIALDLARSSSGFGRTPSTSNPTTHAATTTAAGRPSRTPAWAWSNGWGFMYIAMITGR